MNIPVRDRAHLVERAIEALGGGEAFGPRPATRTPEPPPAIGIPAKPDVSLEALKAAGLIDAPTGQQRSRSVEEVTVVQQQILRGMEEVGAGRNRIVVVTSARPGEGKSFVATNLAASMATNGTRKVILVDVDGKRGSISDLLAHGELNGLRGLAAQERMAPPLLSCEVKNLLLLPYGKPVAGESVLPPGSLISEALARFARALPEHVLIIDTPPSLSTSDAHALSSIAGQVVVVVDAEKTQRNEVEAALDMMEACPNLSLLLNRVRLTASDSFGAYGDYGAQKSG
jgi:protein-tyrosine kinase